jgi:hypothetical protein
MKGSASWNVNPSVAAVLPAGERAARGRSTGRLRADFCP